MLNLWGLRGPLVPPLDRNFGFSQFFLWFCGKTHQRSKFHLPKPSGSAQTFCGTNKHTHRQQLPFIYIDSLFLTFFRIRAHFTVFLRRAYAYSLLLAIFFLKKTIKGLRIRQRLDTQVFWVLFHSPQCLRNYVEGRSPWLKNI